MTVEVALRLMRVRMEVAAQINAARAEVIRRQLAAMRGAPR
jgi:hypothetical protein